MRRHTLFLLALALLVATLGCGYRFAGRRGSLPESIRVVSVPLFANTTSRPKLDQALTAAIRAEFVKSGAVRVCTSPQEGDAVLSGTIRSFSAVPVGLRSDNVSTSFLIQMVVDIRLTERSTGRTLYEANGVMLRDEYTIPERTVDFYMEDSNALARLSESFASSLVTSVLEAL